MLDLDAHTQLAGATADLMRSCVVATAQTMSASACRGLTLWSDMLRAPERRTGSGGRQTASPVEMLWRFSPAGWMPKANPWWPGDWTPSYATGAGWNPYATAWAPYCASWTPFGDWANWGRVYWPAWSFQPAASGPFATPAALSHAALRYASPSTYASYRSAGGHAVAQIIAPAADTVVAGMTATAVFTQMQTMLGVWRAALGA